MSSLLEGSQEEAGICLHLTVRKSCGSTVNMLAVFQESLHWKEFTGSCLGDFLAGPNLSFICFIRNYYYFNLKWCFWILHLFYLHFLSSNNPLRNSTNNKIPFFPFIFQKDFFGFILILCLYLLQTFNLSKNY